MLYRMPNVFAALAVVDVAYETECMRVAGIDNDWIGATRTIDDIVHGVESVLKEQAFPSFKVLRVEHLGHDVDWHVFGAFGVRTLEQLNGALANMHLAHGAHACFAVVVLALVESDELASHLLVETYHAVLKRVLKFFHLFDQVVSFFFKINVKHNYFFNS